MEIPTQAPSKNNAAEFIRILMPILIIVLLVIIVKSFFGNIFSGLGSIGESLGLKNTKEEAAAIEKTNKKLAQLNTNPTQNPFNSGYYKQFNNCHLVTSTVVDKLAETINNAIGYIYDNPENIEGAIKQLSYKTQISFLSDFFYKKYKIDMYEFLQIHLDTAEQKRILGDIITYVNALPTGKI